MNEDELLLKIANLIETDRALVEENRTMSSQSAARAYISIVRDYTIPLADVYYKVEYYVEHIPGKWFPSLITYYTEEEARDHNADVPEDKIRYIKITEYARQAEIL